MLTIVSILKEKKEEEFINYIDKTSSLKNIDYKLFEYNEDNNISKLYNQAIQESKNDIVVFINENIIFDRTSWGQRLIKNFNQNPEYGILGAIGTKILPVSGVWWEDPTKSYGRIIYVNPNDKSEITTNYSPDNGKSVINVSSLFGIFFAIDKKKCKSYFNENINTEFFYDTAFFIENLIRDVKLGVFTNIKIKYETSGDDKDKWGKGRDLFLRFYKYLLPIKLNASLPFEDIEVKIDEEPKLAIVILTKDNYELISNCLDSITEKTKYDNYIIYIADTGSEEEVKRKLKKEYIEKYDRIKLIEYDYYNFAKINNDVIFNHIDKDTELVLLCNNDIKMINDSISIMIKQYISNKDKTGTIGCRLHYEDGYIQHMGIHIVPNQFGRYAYCHKGVKTDFDKIQTNDVISSHGNTGAFLMIPYELYKKYNGLNEEYKVCFEDVELNLEALIDDKINYTCTNAVNYHLESVTRGKTVLQEDYDRISNFIDKNNNKLHIKN